MKLAFIEQLTRQAQNDTSIVLLTGDLGFQIFDDFAERFPGRYVNTGVAEAQLINAAAGLALEGFRPFTYSIASFATARCFEQIKLSLAYHRLPVVVVGAGGGYAYGRSGVTHHAGEDLSLMRILPGMTVVSPGDVHEVKALVPQLTELDGPAYLRIGRGREPDVLLDSPVRLGDARLIAEGEEIALVSTGETLYDVKNAVDMLHDEGIHPLAYQFHTVKPLDTSVLTSMLKRIKTVIVAEFHTRPGGLGSAVAEFFSGIRNAPQVVSLSIPDEFVLGSPTQKEISKRYGMDAQAIVSMVRSHLAELAFA